MKRIEIFDPPMCCSTGVCGPKVDPALVQFVADLHWVANQGVAVERHNLAQEPQAFAASSVVRGALRDRGNECLPLVLLDGSIISEGRYPSRHELATLIGVEVDAASGTAPGNATTGAKLPIVGGCC